MIILPDRSMFYTRIWSYKFFQKNFVDSLVVSAKDLETELCCILIVLISFAIVTHVTNLRC